MAAGYSARLREPLGMGLMVTDGPGEIQSVIQCLITVVTFALPENLFQVAPPKGGALSLWLPLLDV